MNELNSPPPSAAIQLEPVLDEVMDRLDEPDRDAVLLYFFEGRSFAEIGSVLSLSADATRMRVNRALERLRTALAQRGIVSTAAALGTALAGQSALAAPAPLALAVAREALAQVGAVPTSVSIATRLIQGAKTVQFVSCAAGVAALVIFALVRPSGSQEDAETPAPVVTTKFVDPVSEAANIPSTSAAATVAEVSPPAVQPAQPATAAPRLPSAPTRGEFGNLSPAERALLARLWYQHETVAPPPGIGVGLRFSPDAAIIDGFDPLIARGWAATGSQAGIHLTPAGVAFCEAHRDEIDSSPAFRRLANVKARP